MPSAADKTTVDVGVTSTKTKVVGSRSPQDQIKSFEVAVFEYKDDPSEKNMSNIEKVLQVSCNTSLTHWGKLCENVHLSQNT